MLAYLPKSPSSGKRFAFTLLSLLMGFHALRGSWAITSAPNSLHWGIQLFIAFLTVLFGTGFFALAGFVWPTHRLLPDAYYYVRDSSTLRRWYNRLGVGYFRSALMVHYGKPKEREAYYDGTRNGLAHLDYMTRQSEFGHLGALCYILLLSLGFLVGGQWIAFAGITVLNLIGNLYPILLQRFHRARLQRLAAVVQRRLAQQAGHQVVAKS